MSISPLVLAPVPTLPGIDLKASPLEYFKLATAEIIHKALDIPFELAYASVESGRAGKGAVGDFSIALPKFRLKIKPDEIKAKLFADVSCIVPLNLR